MLSIEAHSSALLRVALDEVTYSSLFRLRITEMEIEPLTFNVVTEREFLGNYFCSITIICVKNEGI
jgi:hypothetical protein